MIPVMRIDRVVVHLLEIRIGFSYSMGTMESARSLVVEVAAGPHTGWGECGWANAMSGARADSSTLASRLIDAGRTTAWPDDDDAICRDMIAPLLGADPMRIGALLPRFSGDFAERRRLLREALSIALYDLAGRIAGVPVATLLGGSRRDVFPGMPVVHVGPPAVMARRAASWVKHGYRHVKVKIAGHAEEDAQRVRAIRGAIGEQVPIQLDANDGYPRIEQAVRAIELLKPLGIELYEDMLAAPIADIAALRKATGVRVLVDKESYWPQVLDVCKLGAADVINHHPNLRGGLDVALDIDAVAGAFGVPTAVGSSGVFGIQNTSFQCLAQVVGLTRPCEDIGLSPYYDGPTRGEYNFDRAPSVLVRDNQIMDGLIHMSNAPGLGVEIDSAKVAAAEIHRTEYP